MISLFLVGFEGKVKHISSDTLVEKTAKGDEFFFRVLISIDGREIVSKMRKNSCCKSWNDWAN